ncbi:MAG: hypothetical protein RL762_1341 [Bacteroidota bacterium]|jgi:50S ribosomal subunit-associated GTPase HflX
MRPNPALQNENVAEYLLYIFQIEALVRTINLDITRLEHELLAPAFTDPSQLEHQLSWYRTIVAEMQQRGLQKEGHLDQVEEILMELIYLHNTLLTILNDDKYKGLCEHAHDALQAFKVKSNMATRHDIEVLLHAMFMKLQLKMKKQEISAETEAAFDLFRIQLAYLSKNYKRMKAGELNFVQN